MRMLAERPVCLLAGAFTCLILLGWLLFAFCWPTNHSATLEQVANGQIDGKQQQRQAWLLMDSIGGQWLAANQDEWDRNGNDQASKSFSEQDEQTPPNEPALSSQTTSQLNKQQARARPKRLAANQRPILNEFSFPANLVQGMRFVLMCQVLSDGEPGSGPSQIRWFKDRQELSGGVPGELELVGAPDSSDSSSSSLLFRRVEAEHNGNYTCLATNQLGLSAAYSSILLLKVPPKWKIEPKDRETVQGDQLSIDCQASGNPNPFIRWKFSALAGPLAASGANRGQLTDQLHQPHQPHQSQSQQQQQQQQREQFKLINSNHQLQTLENGSLAFRSIQRDHEGVYLCEADNGLEPALVKPVRVLVHLPAQINEELQLNSATDSAADSYSSSPLLDKSPWPTRAIRLGNRSASVPGHQVRLLCEPSGELPLQLDWLKDGHLIQSHSVDESRLVAAKGVESVASSSSSATSANSLLELGQLHVNTRRKSARPNQIESELLIAAFSRQQAATYTCRARNQYGEAERKLRLLLQEAPEPPDLVDVAHVGSRSIALRWLSPFDGNSPILRYLVETRRQPSETSLSASQSVANYASSSSSSSPASNEEPPVYSEKLIQNGEPASHQVATNSAMAQLQQQVQHTVHELKPLTRYSLRVVAVNALGRSRPSVALSLRTEEEVPSVVPSSLEVLVLSSRSVKLNWTISYSAEHEIIEGFFIGYRYLELSTGFPSSASSSASSDLSPASATNQVSQATVKSKALVEQTTFTYKTIRLASSTAQDDSMGPIRATSRQDQSTASEQPAYLAPKMSLSKHTLLSGYRQPVLTITSTFEYLLTGLERNSDYTLLIQCFNRKGAGPTSEPALFRTLNQDPPEKLLLSAEETTESSIRVSWRQVGQTRAHEISSTPVEGYLLAFARHQNSNVSDLAASLTATATATNPAARVMEQRQPSWQTIQLAPQQHSHLLKGLDCGAAYLMRILAFNKVGKGEPSEALLVSTRGKAPAAPDRRSFVQLNSSQVRLNLGAWYDGGCPIEKFIVQYRARGQQEWNLVSNNIQREQGTILLRDLAPATGYELLVGAQNQVGTTELKYRFTTFDSNGARVSPTGASSLSKGFFPFLSSFAGRSTHNGEQADPLADQQDLDDQDDYNLDGESRVWPSVQTSLVQNPRQPALVSLRNLLGSPLALLISLSLFLAILLMLLFYRTLQERLSNGASPNSNAANCQDTLSSAITSKSSASGSHSPAISSSAAANSAAVQMQQANGQGNFNASPHIANADCLLDEQHSLPFGLIDHPSQLNMQAKMHHRSHDCHYHCSASLEPTLADFYSTSTTPAGHYAPPSALAALNSQYAQVRANTGHNMHEQATNGQVLSSRHQNQPDQDQCLMQMLLLGGSHQQQAVNSLDQLALANQSSASTTLARTTKLSSSSLTSFRPAQQDIQPQYSQPASQTLNTLYSHHSPASSYLDQEPAA